MGHVLQWVCQLSPGKLTILYSTVSACGWLSAPRNRCRGLSRSTRDERSAPALQLESNGRDLPALPCQCAGVRRTLESTWAKIRAVLDTFDIALWSGVWINTKRIKKTYTCWPFVCVWRAKNVFVGLWSFSTARIILTLRKGWQSTICFWLMKEWESTELHLEPFNANQEQNDYEVTNQSFHT